MDLQLTGKRALVTGSTAGIGYSIVRRLVQEGADVVLNGRSQDRVNQSVDAIRKEIPAAIIRGVTADLGTAEGCAQLTDAVPEVEILVNNVGIYEPKPFDGISDDDWIRLFEVNVMSGVRLSRHYLPSMRRKDAGRILFISSESAVQIPAEMIHYGVTKTAQAAVARGLAESLPGTRITVNSILVGPTRSEGVGTFIENVAQQRGVDQHQVEKDFFRSVRPSSLLQRLIEPEEVAAMVAFLASPLSAAVTGSPIRVDGGVIRAIF